MPTATTRMSGSTGSSHNDVSPHMAPSIISSPCAKWMMLVARMIIAKLMATRLHATDGNSADKQVDELGGTKRSPCAHLTWEGSAAQFIGHHEHKG